MQNRAIIWLRRDLRLDDSYVFSALKKLKAKSHIIFIFDSNILKEFPSKNDRRISFIYDRLVHLNELLRLQGSKLNIYFGDPETVIPSILKATKASHLLAALGYEAYDFSRDRKILDICKQMGVNFCLDNDHLIFPPQETTKEDGTIYQVFTPFAKKLFQKIKASKISFFHQNVEFSNIEIGSTRWSIDLNKTKGENLSIIGYETTNYSPWSAKFDSRDIEKFAEKISDYKNKRDFLCIDGTSKFSPYLRFGFISIRQCLDFALKHENSFAWINELLWREFYAVALFHHPEITNQEFNKQYRNINWNNSETYLEKFRSCKTGYPIVDAAMSQLYKEGWMHNRARMVVASFFTKHLFLDWRIGEKIFAQYLMDYEQSSNVGGWQWAASTGFDAQPYFRIFNPYLQSKKFDPNGEYIKKYLPILMDVGPSKIHSEAHLYADYPTPIVSHEDARIKALQKFKAL